MNTNEADIPPDICANCGKGEDSSNTLKACRACKLVKYCNRECQIAHRPQHKNECRQRAWEIQNGYNVDNEKECKKRTADKHDEELFKQPPQPLEDCPICFQRMPLLPSGSQYMSCCGKVVCNGCMHVPLYDDQGNLLDFVKLKPMSIL